MTDISDRAIHMVASAAQLTTAIMDAIPTKDKQLRVLPLSQIKIYVAVFLRFARENPTLTFELTPVGCGLAGYQYGDIGPMFADAPPNVKKPKEFL